MPKLTGKLAKKVDKAEAVHGFGLITPGKYFAQLAAVPLEKDKNEDVVWACEFKNLRSVSDIETPVPGRQWWRLTHPHEGPTPPNQDEKKWETAQTIRVGQLKAFFEAFGYEVEDTDTDEIINEKAWCVLTIGTRKIQQGPRMGEVVNDVKDIESPDDFGDVPEIDDEAGDSFNDETPF